ncbi:MAG: adenine methyltransferase [Anaerolineae bacterium]|nr:adenine methyltransferase [Anaerolineae bacterium]
MSDQGHFFEPNRRGYIAQSKSCEWSTPGWLFRQLDREFGFTVDVAASDAHHCCPKYYTEEQDGLAQPWRNERIWCNPPYDVQSLTAFVAKAWEVTRAWPNTLAVLLVPVKSDQRWWHDYAMQGEIRFIRGRVRFGGEAGAPMPVCVVVLAWGWGPRMVSMAQDDRQTEIGP